MMRRMSRKPIHSFGVLIFCAVYVATLSAQPCIPSSMQTRETDGNCVLGNNPPWDSSNTNVKLVYYLVTWPDNVSGHQANNGNGQCHLAYQCNGSYNWDVYCGHILMTPSLVMAIGVKTCKTRCILGAVPRLALGEITTK